MSLFILFSRPSWYTESPAISDLAACPLLFVISHQPFANEIPFSFLTISQAYFAESVQGGEGCSGVFTRASSKVHQNSFSAKSTRKIGNTLFLSLFRLYLETISQSSLPEPLFSILLPYIPHLFVAFSPVWKNLAFVTCETRKSPYSISVIHFTKHNCFQASNQLLFPFVPPPDPIPCSLRSPWHWLPFFVPKTSFYELPV